MCTKQEILGGKRQIGGCHVGQGLRAAVLAHVLEGISMGSIDRSVTDEQHK